MRRSLPRLSLVIAPLVMTACAPEGPSGFVTNHLHPDDECVLSNEPGANASVPQGLYDIATGANGNEGSCDAPYMMYLFVNSFLRSNSDQGIGRAEPNVLQLHSAEVRLMDIGRSPIAFDRFAPDVLPNPFLVTTNASLFPTDGDEPSTAVASVEAIPSAYAEQLDRFAREGQQILAEVQIFGTTTGDVDVDLKPFVYTIRLCDGCLTDCADCYIGTDISPDEIYGEGVCRDNSGADGRLCLDTACTCPTR